MILTVARSAYTSATSDSTISVTRMGAIVKHVSYMLTLSGIAGSPFAGLGTGL